MFQFFSDKRQGWHYLGAELADHLSTGWQGPWFDPGLGNRAYVVFGNPGPCCMATLTSTRGRAESPPPSNGGMGTPDPSPML